MAGKLVLSHDVDDINKRLRQLISLYRVHRNHFAASELLKKIFSQGHNWLHFERIMEMETRFGAKSTFFFMLDGSRYFIDNQLQEIIRSLDSRGWEICVHGSIESNDDPKAIEKEKKMLEGMVGHEIIGIRQHYLKLGDKTWSHQKSCGYSYDSSLCKMNDVSTDQPFLPLHDFAVLPINAMDAALFDGQYMGLDLVQAKSIVSKSLEEAARNDLFFTLDLHQDWFIFKREQELYRFILERARNLDMQMMTMKEAANAILG